MKAVGPYEYDKKDEIGRGAFGTVFKGRNKMTSTEVVAIKRVNVKNYKVTVLHDTINRETKILEKVSNPSHKNIVTLLHHEKLVDYAAAYFVMEFCNGGSLREYIQSKEKLGESVIKTFLQQIAAGLTVAHDMRIIHRDLKPENILLCFSGSNYPSPDRITLKIADFGIGRFLHSDQKAITNCGSMPYMAPEVLHGRQGGYDYTADLWSLGVIAYECLVGSLPGSLISINGFKTPVNATKDFANLLQGLLENDEKKRFTLKRFLDHPFFGNTIAVAVCGPSGETTMMQVKEDQNADHLIDIIRATYRIDSKDFYLMHNGEILEGGSSKSLRESGIAQYSSIIFNAEVRAGRVMKRYTNTSEMLWAEESPQL